MIRLLTNNRKKSNWDIMLVAQAHIFIYNVNGKIISRQCESESSQGMCSLILKFFEMTPSFGLLVYKFNLQAQSCPKGTAEQGGKASPKGMNE